MNIVYRTPVPDEAASFGAMLDGLDHETEFMLYEPGERPKDLTRVKGMLAGAFEHPENSFLQIAEADGRMVGFVSAQRGGVRRTVHSAYVVAGIRSGFRGQGLGTALFERLISWAEANNVVRLELTVCCENAPALKLYQKFGFQIEGVRRASLRVNGILKDEYAMARFAPLSKSSMGNSAPSGDRNSLAAESASFAAFSDVSAEPSVLGERNGVILRRACAGDADAYFQNFDPLDPEVARLTGCKPSFTRSEVVNFFLQCLSDETRRDFLLVAPDGRILGESVINEIDDGCANYRVALFDPETRGKGLGGWAIRRTVDYAFSVLKLHRLSLEVFSFNPRAQRAYLAAGFIREGVLRKAVRDGDGWADVILMSILKDDWQKQLKR